MDAEALRLAARVEDDHWWYRGRRRILADIIAELPLSKPARVLDAGCGTGRQLVELSGLGHVFGLEVDAHCVALASSRNVGTVAHGTLEAMPYEADQFDLVTCLDVIEHVEREGVALRELRRITRSGGYLVVTAPAYQWLWSQHDVASHHHRRHTHKSLLRAASAEGWKPVRDGYFNSLLFAPAAAVRLSERLRREPPERKFDLSLTPPWANRILEAPLRAEACLIRRGKRIPFGMSVFAVLRAG